VTKNIDFPGPSAVYIHTISLKKKKKKTFLAILKYLTKTHKNVMNDGPRKRKGVFSLMCPENCRLYRLDVDYVLSH
jgi:hypothetical protein